MTKKLLSIAMMLIGIICANAQMPQPTPLPLNPKVKTGKLPNGLSYYILHNEMPKERANFYIAQKVGSTLETEEQLGLAHFLEHMAFNGTKNYPGKSMLNYLQSKGIRFGADINAYTSFDETVYNINNVPTTDKPLMDSVLLVLHDWSGDILLEESEIDAERGVIEEEWRTRNNASFRMYSDVLPKIYSEYQYQQMPIGKMEIVRNFKPEVLRAYYKKWYRPDQQGIVIVGDFDADEMEKKVIAMFSDIEMPADAAPREYPTVSDNKEPIYAAFTDPELSASRTTISFKSDKMPLEMRNTVEYYAGVQLVQSILTQLINNRLSEAAQNPDCTYAGAGVYFGDFYVSKTKDSFNIVVLPKQKTLPALEEVMAIVARACKTGFTQSEFDRVKDNILSSYEKSYNEREKTLNDALGSELCTYFVDNEPAPGIETEFTLMQQILPNLPLQAVNMVASQLLTDENMVILTSEPKKDGFEIVAEDVMVKSIKDAMAAQYEAYVDEVITEPLIAQLPKPGKIVSTSTDDKIGAEVFTLSNGVKVYVKHTDFAADEILMTAYRDGGKQTYKAEQATNLKLLSAAFSTTKKGPFDNKTLEKYLAGKNVGIEFEINNYTDVLSGNSTVKDLPTLMELIYTAFTNVSEDESTYSAMTQRLKSRLQLQESNPQYIFFREMRNAMFGGNPLLMDIAAADVDQANYQQMVAMAKKALSNAADYTFIFTGNVDVATLRPLLEQYIATLPVAKADKPAVVSDLKPATGKIMKDFKQPMQAPATFVFDSYIDFNVPFTQKNSIMVTLMGDVLDNIYTNTLREEEGGTYGASVGASYNPTLGMWQLQYFFQTNNAQQQTLINRAYSEMQDLLSKGASEEEFNKAKEAMLKQHEIQVKRNAYWDSNIMTYLRGWDLINGYKEAIESVTLSDLNNFMKGIYDGKNRMEVVMEGVQAE